MLSEMGRAARRGEREIAADFRIGSRKLVDMVMRVQRRGDEYCVVISQQALEALHLTEGAEVELRAVDAPETAVPPVAVRYVTVAEALESYERREPLHRNAYRELAK